MAPCQVIPSESASPSDYKKVLKPLLERRRRARINRCLDQMRDLMVDALSMEGDSAAKLEKADVLELAVRHLQKLQAQRRAAAPAAPAAPAASPQTELDRYRAGFSAAATVVSRALAFTPGVDVELGTRVMQHLGSSFRALDQRRLSAPLTVEVPQFRTRVPVTACPASPADSCSSGYSSGADSGLLTVVTPVSAAPRAPASSQCSPSPLNLKLGDEGMWRPW
ncbi:enhancer of split mbeta protein-like [Amphibalanus amphitrite]|uniref:enhancer of split mbeta protein-like n=1 Tax=Amphibalanus amphitrite TaxID=1232801 RepID=UPI001C8FAEBA|nr:enhancer of split mbeta protein-like [Amphibalanus amphitrite]